MSKEDFPIYNQLLVNIEKRNATIEALGWSTEQKLERAKELAALKAELAEAKLEDCNKHAYIAGLEHANYAMLAELEDMDALKAPASEPVAIVQSHTALYGLCTRTVTPKFFPAGTKLYTAPPNTDELVAALEKIARVNAMGYEYQAWAKEALAKWEESK